jgi:integrase
MTCITCKTGNRHTLHHGKRESPALRSARQNRYTNPLHTASAGRSHAYATTSLDAGIDPKIVADRIGHANMAYTLAIYTHKSTGKDRGAAETVAGVILGTGWACERCGAAYFGSRPDDGLCAMCAEA